MNFKRVLASAAAFTLVASVAVGCGTEKQKSADQGQGDAGKAKANQEIKINFTADPPALDISKTTANASFTMLAAVHEGLFRLDKDGKAVPGLAKEAPKISDDGLTYTFTLRDGLKWADGSPLTAKDFVYSYQRTLTPDTKAQYSFMLSWIKGGKEMLASKTPEELEAAKKNLGVVAKDDKTLEITLVKPITFFTELTAFATFFPQKQDFVEKQGAKYGADADKIIGAGPFVLQSWDHEQKLVLVKNPNYWDAANVKLDKVTVNIVKDNSTGLNLFETNEADVTELTGDLVQLYQGKPEFTLKKELTNCYIMFQEKKVPAFANANIRAALTMAIDRKALVETVLKNGSTPSTGFVPAGTLDGGGGDFRKAAGDLQPPYDPAKAKELLQKGLQELGLQSLPKFKLTADDKVDAKKTIEFILAQWKQNLNVEAEGEPVPHELRIDKQKNHNYDAVLALWGADYNDPMTFLDMWVTGGEFNEVDWSNAKYDELIKKADAEKNPAERAKSLVEAEKILTSEAPVGTLYFRNRVYAKKQNVEGFILAPYGQEWELKWTYMK